MSIPVLRGVEHLADWVVPQHMGDVLLVPVAVPAHLVRHLQGEFNGIGTGILAVVLQTSDASSIMSYCNALKSISYLSSLGNW